MYKIKAPAFPSHLTWLNSAQSWALTDLKGQVVVLDFWTYCCINCIHVLPELQQLETEFHDKPVAVIGVHAAKFDNENDPQHIQSAIDRYEIAHPVVIDSDHEIWNQYAVRAWPTLVIIDAEGYIRWHGSGEGHTAEIKNIINQLLLEAKRTKHLASQPAIKPVLKPAPAQTLRFPGKICFDDSGQRLFISDSNHHRILETQLITPTELKVTTVIGSGQPGFKDGAFLTAQFNQPQGLTYSAGYLYVADTKNHALRQIWVGESTQDKGGQAPMVTTLAGLGYQAAWGDGGGAGPRTALNSPWDILYYDQYLWIAMAGSHQVWRYDFNTREILPWAGSGIENIADGPREKAQLAQPSGLSWNGHHLFVADSETSSIRGIELNQGSVETIVGAGLFEFGYQDGKLDEALFQHPLGLAARDHLIYVADTYNHALRVIDLEKQTVVSLVRPHDQTTCQIGDKMCQILPLYEPNDVKLHGHHLYIADTNNHLIRLFDLQTLDLLDVTIGV